MSVNTDIQPIPYQEPEDKYVLDTRVSTYDKTSAFLIASVMILGLMTFLAFLIWLTLFEWGSAPTAVVLQEEAGNDDRPEGVAEDWQEPGVEEFPEVPEPQLADSLEALTESVSSVKARLEKYDGNAPLMGAGSGLGDIRASGPGNGTGNALSEAKRWKIEYSATRVAEYAKQLDYFRVQLGAVSKTTPRIDLISDLTQSRPRSNYTNKSEEKRIYFSYAASRLKRWDQALARRAGVTDVNTRDIVQFYEEDVRGNLRLLEAQYIAKEGKTVIDVEKCYFRVRPKGSGYEYYVHKVEYRLAPRA